MKDKLTNNYPELVNALNMLSSYWKEDAGKWLLGGSCSLWLQGVKLAAPPRDIDVYADPEESKILHKRLSEVAIDEPRLDQSGFYTSLLSHYQCGGLTIELVGGFEIRSQGAFYRTEVTEVLSKYSSIHWLDDAEIHLMPLAHEFVFNILRGRPDRYLAIAEVIRREPDRHLPLLSVLLRRNEWTADIVAKMAEVLDRPLLSQPWREHRPSED